MMLPNRKIGAWMAALAEADVESIRLGTKDMAVFPKRFDEELSPARKLAPEDAVRTVSFVQRPAFIGDWTSEVLGGVLILEALDTVAIRAREEKADHRVVEATVDEVIDVGRVAGGSGAVLDARLLGRADHHPA